MPQALGTPAPLLSPTGKGVFVRTVEGAGGIDNIVARARWAGLRWICVQSYWKDHGENLNAPYLHQLASELAKHGIGTWLWGWPLANDLHGFANVIQASIKGLLFRGLVLDIEGEDWFGKATEASVIISAMKKIVQARPVGVSSYGLPSNAKDMPWSSMTSADFSVPQVYHGHQTTSYGADYQAVAMNEWSQLGFERLVPALAAWDVTPDEMRAVYARTPRPENAVIWWDFYTLELNPQLWWPVREAGRRFTGTSARR